MTAFYAGDNTKFAQRLPGQPGIRRGLNLAGLYELARRPAAASPHRRARRRSCSLGFRSKQRMRPLGIRKRRVSRAECATQFCERRPLHCVHSLAGVISAFGNNPFLCCFSRAWRSHRKPSAPFRTMGSRGRKNYTDHCRLILIDDYTVDRAGFGL